MAEPSLDTSRKERLNELREVIRNAAHYLPSQGPITVFVHHNTLHAFEDTSFDEGVVAGGLLYGCHAYLPEDDYREKLRAGRIRLEDIESVLLDDLEEDADRLVARFGTRYALRLAMLQTKLRTGPPAELRWVIAETDALRSFRADVGSEVRDRMIVETRRWMLDQVEQTERSDADNNLLDSVGEQFDLRSIWDWNERKWEAFALNFLWRVCSRAVRSTESAPSGAPHAALLRHRDTLLQASGIDTDEVVHELLIRFCSLFLDQGFTDWTLPNRADGFYQSFIRLYSQRFAAPTPWLRVVARETRRLKNRALTPLESIAESLVILGIDPDETPDFVRQTLLALKGWAGMVWQMETNAEWTPHPAPAESLVEFVAIRLLLDRLAIKEAIRKVAPGIALSQVRQHFSESTVGAPNGLDQKAFVLFQVAQARGWTPKDLQYLTADDWKAVLQEIDAFSSLERRRIFHRAFEQKYRNETLDALTTHARRVGDLRTHASVDFQVTCCIDEREESFRRHLEEVDPACETFGVAGFFGVAMYYRGIGEAHFKPLCPVNVKPHHFVVEEPLFSFVQAEQVRAEARRRIGQAAHQAHRGTRRILGGAIAGLLGSLATVPLVARVLFPRVAARLRRTFGRFVRTPHTCLRLERVDGEPGPMPDQRGYSIDEMAAIVDSGLRTIGLVSPSRFAPLIVICGHGSSSLNNPHEAAHDCGACGGGRGGPNARAFAEMANDRRVRRIVADRGLSIPDETHFVGCYHNTCDDSVIWYDLDSLPVPHRDLFQRAKKSIDCARRRSAHERCRRFESAELDLADIDALRHVEERAEDLSQTRPEYGHATNALCFVGRRSWSRGLFLDRRAFLTSYDPESDDDQASILEKLLQAVIPVCAGINLEYYFSFVDATGYGCGTKLPHNITSLLGVMDGAASDLRPGLPWQMVEIHEPVRLLFVIDTTEQAMRRIMRNNAAISRLVEGGWVQLAIFDPSQSLIALYSHGEFGEYEPSKEVPPTVRTSAEWYRAQRDHLGFASVASDYRTSERR